MPENESTMKWKVDILQLKAAMADAKRSISLANAEFKAATSGMDKWSKSTTGIEAKLKQLNTVLPQQKTILSQLEKQYELTAKEMGADSEAAQKLKIQIENQKAAINQTEASISKYNGELDQLKKAEIEAASPMNQLNKTIGEQEDQLKDLKTAYSNAILQYGKNSAEAKALAKDIDKLSGELKQNKTKAKEASDAADNLDKSVDKAGKSADKSSGKFKNFASVLGDAAKGALVAFGAAVAGAITGLTKSTVDAAAYADEINTLSLKTGIATDKLQQYKYAAELTDTSLETITGSMAKMIKTMSGAADGSSEAAATYKKLGVSVTDSNGKLRDNEDVFWDVIDALGKMEEGADRDAISMQIFGKSAQDLNPLIAAGKDQMKAYAAEATKMGAVLSSDQLNNLGAFDDSVQRLKQGANAVKNALGTILLPELQKLADEGTGLLGKFTEGIRNANGDWSKISEVIGTAVGDLAKKAFEKLPDLINLAGQILVSTISQILPAIETAIKTAMQLVLTCLPIITQSLFTLLGDIATWLAEGDNATQLVNSVIQLVSQLASQLSEVLPILIPALVEIVSQISLALCSPENTKLLISAVLQLASAIFVALVNSVPKLIDFIKGSIKNLANLFADFLSWIVPHVASGIEKAVNTVKSWGNQIKDFIFGLIDKIRTAIVDWINNIKITISTGFNALVDKVVSIGTNLVAGIWKGVSGSYDWIKSRITEWVGNVVNFFRKLLKISSPSEVMAESVGKWMPEGIAAGFESDMPSALASMKKSLSGAIGDLKTNVALNSAGMLGDVTVNGSASEASGSKQQIINFNQTINSPKAVDGMTLYRDTNSLLFSAKVRLGNV